MAIDSLSQWRYTPYAQRSIGIRSEPTTTASKKTGEDVQPGDVILIDEERIADEATFLRLADGRGWLFDRLPAGVMCVREASKFEDFEVSIQRTRGCELRLGIATTFLTAGGFRINLVHKDGPMAAKDVRVGDIIVQVNGKSGANALSAAMRNSSRSLTMLLRRLVPDEQGCNSEPKPEAMQIDTDVLESAANGSEGDASEQEDDLARSSAMESASRLQELQEEVTSRRRALTELKRHELLRLAKSWGLRASGTSAKLRQSLGHMLHKGIYRRTGRPHSGPKPKTKTELWKQQIAEAAYTARNRGRCARCGRTSHTAEQCFARSMVGGLTCRNCSDGTLHEQDGPYGPYLRCNCCGFTQGARKGLRRRPALEASILSGSHLRRQAMAGA